MKANDIVNAIRNKHGGKAAIVPELTIEDRYYYQSMIRRDPRFEDYANDSSIVDENYQVDETYDLANGKYSRRIDLLMCEAQKWTAIEIKVSRSDFFRDTEEKRQTWKKHTHRFIYATPQGLVNIEEIPEGCGWWEITPTGMIIVSKRAKVNKDRTDFPDSFMRTVFWRLATTSPLM